MLLLVIAGEEATHPVLMSGCLQVHVARSRPLALQ